MNKLLLCVLIGYPIAQLLGWLYLWLVLNCHFDPKFKRHVTTEYLEAPFGFDRALAYATWVVRKEFFAMNDWKVLEFDTRAGLSKFTIWICYFVVINFSIFVVMAVVVGSVNAIRWLWEQML